MKRRSGEALLLQTIDLHERDRIVVFLSRQWGLKRGAARSARARFSRFGGELRELAKVHLLWFEKPGRDLVRLAEAEMIRSPGALHTDLEGFLVSSYLAEHMQTFVQENDPDDRFYRLLDSTVQALTDGCDRSLAARYLECWTLRLAGVFPTPRQCPSCGAAIADEAVLAADAAGILCPSCGAGAGGNRRIGEPALSFLRRIGGADLARLSQNGSFEESTLKSVEAIAREVRRAFLGKELRSYGVMQRTLRDVAS